MNPQYPVYVVSKGRWKSRLTVKSLERIKIPHRVVVEPQELDQYAAVMDPTKLLVLPFSNLGQGSIPARNWIWEHAVSEGAARHWILDDNISGFFRLNDNKKIPVGDGAIFHAAEAFVDRYENVALAGFQYFSFAPRKAKHAPFIPNTRIYSHILIQNDVPHRWRGRYNEDTDLSLRILKDGWCTILFMAFLANKMPTMSMKGGNTEALYKLDTDDGRLLMAQSLKEQHPDVVSIERRWNRWQHVVDYRRFRQNALRRRPGVVVPEGVDNFGMTLEVRTPITTQEAQQDAQEEVD